MISSISFYFLTFATCLSGLVTTPLLMFYGIRKSTTSASVVIIAVAGLLAGFLLFTAGCRSCREIMQILQSAVSFGII